MSSQPVTRLTPEEYLELDRKNEFRSEYVNGEMFAMAGGTRNHARIVLNTVRRLADQLDRSPCEAAAGDLRVYIPKYQVFTYPDIVVTCGIDQYHNGRRDTILDAAMIVEVLSPSTKNYDRAQKFDYYRSLPSFAEYLLLAQDAVRAELHTRLPDGAWLFREFTAPADMIELKSIGCHLELQTLYERVQFAVEEEA